MLFKEIQTDLTGSAYEAEIHLPNFKQKNNEFNNFKFGDLPGLLCQICIHGGQLRLEGFGQVCTREIFVLYRVSVGQCINLYVCKIVYDSYFKGVLHLLPPN